MAFISNALLLIYCKELSAEGMGTWITTHLQEVLTTLWTIDKSCTLLISYLHLFAQHPFKRNNLVLIFLYNILHLLMDNLNYIQVLLNSTTFITLKL